MTEQLLTQTSEFDHPAEGYIIIAPLSDESKERIKAIQGRFVEAFGKENLWLPEGDQLHITFGHIITPNVEYEEDRSVLFSKVRPLASSALSQVVQHQLKVTSEFDTIEAFPSAVIVKAHDDGSFDQLRQSFTDRFQLPEGTRTPPEIIHTTLLRFRNQVDLGEVSRLTEEIMADFEPFEEHTTKLQMIREKKIFVQDHDVLEEFPPAK